MKHTKHAHLKRPAHCPGDFLTNGHWLLAGVTETPKKFRRDDGGDIQRPVSQANCEMALHAAQRNTAEPVTFTMKTILDAVARAEVVYESEGLAGCRRERLLAVPGCSDPTEPNASVDAYVLGHLAHYVPRAYAVRLTAGSDKLNVVTLAVLDRKGNVLHHGCVMPCR